MNEHTFATSLRGETSSRERAFRQHPRQANRLRLAKAGFALAAGGSFLFSVSLWFSGFKQEGVFVGLWVPSILSFGTLILGGRRDE